MRISMFLPLLKAYRKLHTEESCFPLFEHFIQEGRLTMRLFPNKNQLSNFLDAIRDLDISDYDLFAKIDDDDLYGRDYFKSINDFHQHLPTGISAVITVGFGPYPNARGGYPLCGNGFFSCFGTHHGNSAGMSSKN